MGQGVGGGSPVVTRELLARLGFGAALVLVAANALLFAAQAAMPLVVSDDWLYLDTIVRKCAQGALGLGDFFGKRGPLDHAQPLRKLILLFHYRYFDLDYSIASLIGVLAAFANLGFLWALVRSTVADGAAAGRIRLHFLALAAVYLSLNTAVTLEWPLLAMSYTNHTFLLGFFLAAWWAIHRGHGWRAGCALFLSAFVLDLVADDTGLIGSLAVAFAAVVGGGRRRGWRAALGTAAPLAAAYLAYAVFRHAVTMGLPPPDPHPEQSPALLLAGLLAQLPRLPLALLTPLVASVAHRFQLRPLLGPASAGVEWAVAAVMVAVHAWFWWRALRGPRRPLAFLATCLMLYMYGAVAAMTLTRVSLHDVAYYWMPRYVLIYSLNVVAILLLAIDRCGSTPGSRGAATEARLMAAFACALILVQVPWSLQTWRSVRYLSHNQREMALDLGRIAKDPTAVPADCSQRLAICQYDPDERRDAIRFLQRNRLNVFSPSFQDRHRLYPD